MGFVAVGLALFPWSCASALRSLPPTVVLVVGGVLSGLGCFSARSLCMAFPAALVQCLTNRPGQSRPAVWWLPLASHDVVGVQAKS